MAGGWRTARAIEVADRPPPRRTSTRAPTPPSPPFQINPYVSELSLYDIAGTPGVAADLSHINTKAVVTGYAGPDQLHEALKGCDVVIIPAGVPRKPGMTRDDLFKINAGIVRDLVSACADACPRALLNVISNPVNSTVPIAAEVLKKAGVYDPRRLLGVTTLDVVRARSFVAEAAGVSPVGLRVPVVGGHAGVTILPLLSQATTASGRKVVASAVLSDEKVAALTARIQDAGTEVVTAKAGKGSATLSMAYAAFEFAKACLAAMGGERGVVECCYVESFDAPGGAPFFARPVLLGPQGVAEYLPLGPLSASEKEGLGKLAGELESSIKKGVEFVRKL